MAGNPGTRIVGRVVAEISRECPGQAVFACCHGDQRDLGTGEVDGGQQTLRFGASGDSTTWSAIAAPAGPHTFPVFRRCGQSPVRCRRFAGIEVDHQNRQATES